MVIISHARFDKNSDRQSKQMAVFDTATASLTPLSFPYTHTLSYSLRCFVFLSYLLCQHQGQRTHAPSWLR
ncbi:hypothetical protein EH105704_13_00020 [Atlantibacter hermannii NBRC 105704]|uniref:Uncharacterized protein n=1 Tax=Atlantibacter hermannii NBRC 105704 TaxID=1115512 RepID=H5V5F7_ATLHE|nr:hypothetical protein EH105704_13_00020 [Atlantibacter hermannii NBRC 105704]VDZ71537.1 Uncharacterised protein [Atlantibacter hermannii]